MEAQTYDALVRDAQPATAVVPAAGNQPMVVVFSAGNAGSSAQHRRHAGRRQERDHGAASEDVQAFGGADVCGVSDAGADSANDMAHFSSRGPPTTAGSKPDIVAPGRTSGRCVAGLTGPRSREPGRPTPASTATASAAVSARLFPRGAAVLHRLIGHESLRAGGGGGAALVRQRFLNDGLAPPSPAMTKALLVNSARYMTGAGANDTLPSNSQGVGMMNLDRSLSQMAAPRVLLDQRAA